MAMLSFLINRLVNFQDLPIVLQCFHSENAPTYLWNARDIRGIKMSGVLSAIPGD